MAWGTLQIVNSMDAYLDRNAIIKTMEQLYQQNIVKTMVESVGGTITVESEAENGACFLMLFSD